MYLFIKEPVCDTDDDDNRLTHFKTPLRLRACGVIISRHRLGDYKLIFTSPASLLSDHLAFGS